MASIHPGKHNKNELLYDNNYSQYSNKLSQIHAIWHCFDGVSTCRPQDQPYRMEEDGRILYV